MNIIVKHIIEIAGGLVVGSLAGDAVDKVIDVSKKAIKDHKKVKVAQ